jgi:hypothetical protein
MIYNIIGSIVRSFCANSCEFNALPRINIARAIGLRRWIHGEFDPGQLGTCCHKFKKRTKAIITSIVCAKHDMISSVSSIGRRENIITVIS